MESSLSFLGLNSTHISIQTEIRPPHWQASIKSTHYADINRINGEVLETGYTTGVTKLFGKNIPSVRDNFFTIPSQNEQTIDIRMTGQTATGAPMIMNKPTGILPNINYDITVSIDKQTGEAKLSGAHDGFPSYTISVDGEVIYNHQQTNELDLFGTDDIKIRP